MSKEIKAAEMEETMTSGPVVEEEIESSPSIKLCREKFVSNGKTYWGYFVSGNIAGKPMTAEFIPLDVGGYEVLDLVFAFSEEADIKVTKTVSKNNMGCRVTYTSYEAENFVPNTTKRLHCGIRPSKNSDQAVFDMIVQFLDS